MLCARHFILTVPLFTQVIDQVPVQTVKNLRGLEAIYSIRWKRIHIAIIIILIDSCNGNKQTNCNLLFSKKISYLRIESKHLGIIVERNKSHTKQSKSDFAVPA